METSLLATVGLSTQGELAVTLLEQLAHSGHLKDSHTQRYLFSNPSNSAFYGFDSSEDLVGATVHDLNAFMSPFWGSAYADTVTALDRQVHEHQQSVCDANRVFLARSGLLRVQNMLKIPIMGMQSRKVVAIFTVTENLTPQLDMMGLMGLYKKQYHKPALAIRYFLHHVNLVSYFQALPTPTEMDVLLASCQNSNQKSLASRLGVTVKTIETHLAHVREKLQGISWSCLLEQLRNVRPA